MENMKSGIFWAVAYTDGKRLGTLHTDKKTETEAMEFCKKELPDVMVNSAYEYEN